MKEALEAARTSHRALVAVGLALVAFVSAVDVAAPYRAAQKEFDAIAELVFDGRRVRGPRPCCDRTAVEKSGLMSGLKALFNELGLPTSGIPAVQDLLHLFGVDRATVARILDA